MFVNRSVKLSKHMKYCQLTNKCGGLQRVVRAAVESGLSFLYFFFSIKSSLITHYLRVLFVLYLPDYAIRQRTPYILLSCLRRLVPFCLHRSRRRLMYEVRGSYPWIHFLQIAIYQSDKHRLTIHWIRKGSRSSHLFMLSKAYSQFDGVKA